MLNLRGYWRLRRSPALDWTEVVHDAGLHPAVVCWPATEMLQEAGFVDAYRKVHPDPVKRPGFTWTVLTKEDDPADHHDRIDFGPPPCARTST